MSFANVYEDRKRAESYARLEFPGTYYLAYRDLPEIIAAHAKGNEALDFGCGTGRSTRFLKKLGFRAIGIDISEDMLKLARATDPEGDYRIVPDGDVSQLSGMLYDVILSVFTFDNIPTRERKVALFSGLRDLMTPEGCLISVVSSPEIYTHEWASFTTKDFPENRLAKSGDRVKIIMTDVEDRRPVEDIVWADDAYREVYGASGLHVVQMHKPLARADEPYQWVNETTIAPWTIYVLRRA